MPRLQIPRWRSLIAIDAYSHHPTNMPRSKYQEAKERKRLRAEAEREKDMIYHVLFQRKDWEHGDPAENRYYPAVPAHDNPDKNPKALRQAIEDFQSSYGVSDWKEITDGYKASGYWYG